jgi:hypothetical protein
MPDRLIGRTAVFGAVSLGSSPSRATIKKEKPKQQCFGFFYCTNYKPNFVKYIVLCFLIVGAANIQAQSLTKENGTHIYPKNQLSFDLSPVFSLKQI